MNAIETRQRPLDPLGGGQAERANAADRMAGDAESLLRVEHARSRQPWFAFVT
jgi:hypothetical protein